MRTLYLLRHAKSSWDDPGLRDRDRPLAPRGRKAAKRIAGHLDRERIRPALVLCSPARRARDTLTGIAGALGEPQVLVEERLYAANEEELLARLREVPDEVPSVLLVGHNPGVAGLVALLSGSGLPAPDRVPTGALATLAFDTGSWAELRPGGGRLEAFVTPRELE